jgi:hypothetical protein
MEKIFRFQCKIEPLVSSMDSHIFFNRGDTSITARLQTRKYGQAPILLFLTPGQALSSHPRISVMILCGVSEIFIQLNNFFKLLAPGIEPLTLRLQVQCSPTPRALLATFLFIHSTTNHNAHLACIRL